VQFVSHQRSSACSYAYIYKDIILSEVTPLATHNISPDGRQRSPRRYFILPCVGFCAFAFHVLRFIYYVGIQRWSQRARGLRLGLRPLACWDWGFESCRGRGSRLGVLCVFRYRCLRWADHSSRWVLLRVVCLSVIVKPRPWPTRGFRAMKRKIITIVKWELGWVY